jgi:hypothetical protein
MKSEDLLKRATHDLHHVEKKVSHAMIVTSHKEAADSLKGADQQLIRAQTLMDDASKMLSVADKVIKGHNRLVRCAVRGSVKQQVKQFDKRTMKLTITKQFDKRTTKLAMKHLLERLTLEESADKLQTKLKGKLKKNADTILAGKISILVQRVRVQKKEDFIRDESHRSNLM